MENGRHKLFTFQLSKLDPHLVNEKLGQILEKLDCTAKSPGEVLLKQVKIIVSTLLRKTHSSINLVCFAKK